MHTRSSGRACTCLGWAKHLPEPPQVCTPVIPGFHEESHMLQAAHAVPGSGRQGTGAWGFWAKKSGVKHFIYAKIGIHSSSAPWQGLISPWWWIIWHFRLTQTRERSCVLCYSWRKHTQCQQIGFICVSAISQGKINEHQARLGCWSTENKSELFAVGSKGERNQNFSP